MLPTDMLRFICQSCGVKWFLQSYPPHPRPQSCAACGGPLVVFEDDDGPPDGQSFGVG